MHLLIVEDERALCETIVRSLRRLAYSVDYCYDGDKALELLAVKIQSLLHHVFGRVLVNLPHKRFVHLSTSTRRLSSSALTTRRITWESTGRSSVTLSALSTTIGSRTP